MSSDGQISTVSIIKEECMNCGTVRSSDLSFVNNFYSDEYSLNQSNNDPSYVYDNIAQPKSEMHYEWIERLCGNRINLFNSIIEIGCGSGNLLKLFKIQNKFGVEPSIKAAYHANKIAQVRNIGFELISNDEKYDVVLSTCVIEHTLNPNQFLKKINKILTENGFAIIGLPIQDAESFDVYFLDHLHHFTINQFMYLCQKNGFTVENYEVGYKCMTTIGYFILRKDKTTELNLNFERNSNFELASKWLNNLDSFLQIQKSIKPVVFGFGETSFFFQTYSKINDVVQYYIDDTRAGIDKNVLSTKSARDLGLLENRTIILLTNPNYHEFIKNNLKEASNLKFYSPFSNDTTD
jgi:SAM-dependent methyltransferase